MSHPAWVCGLKQFQPERLAQTSVSHPAWVCGLKHTGGRRKEKVACHTLRGCVD